MSLMVEKSLISANSRVHLTTLLYEQPASSKIACILFIACLASAATPPGTKFPVWGSKPMHPDTYKVLSTSTPWLYGPVKIKKIRISSNIYIP